MIAKDGSGEDECYVSPTSEGDYGSLSEECSGNNCGVYEYFCNGPDYRGHEVISCKNGCKNGACL